MPGGTLHHWWLVRPAGEASKEASQVRAPHKVACNLRHSGHGTWREQPRGQRFISTMDRGTKGRRGGLTRPPDCPNLSSPCALPVNCVSQLPTLRLKPHTGASMLSLVAPAEKEGGWAWERGLKGQAGGGRLPGRGGCE